MQGKCPNCGNNEADLIKLDSLFAQRLRDSGVNQVHEQVCSNCYQALASNISHGAVLRAKDIAKTQHNLTLWRNRVSILKQAKQHMENRAFSEAAVMYEKYIRIIEIVYDKKSGELEPTLFKNNARQKEINVLTSVYWDLVRIYDSSPKYSQFLDKAISKLLQFVPHSTLLPIIAKNAESFAKSAQNKNHIKRLVDGISRKRACFIATAVFESETSHEVMLLRWYRDHVLLKKNWGPDFIRFYYQLSPHLVPLLKRVAPLRFITRALILCVMRFLKIQIRA